MAMSVSALSVAAEEAEAAAAGFDTFRPFLPEHASEVTALISEFYAISSSLSSLETLSKDPRYLRNWPRALPDLELVRSSLKYSIEDIFDFLASSKVARSAHESIGGPGRGSESLLFVTLRSNIKTLVADQEKRLAPRLGRMNFGRHSFLAREWPPSSTSTESPSPANDWRPRRRSYDRSRPSHASPQSPQSPSSGTFSDWPPSVPDAPSSPLGSTTATTTSRSTHSEAVQYHWVKDVFSGFDTETPLPPARERAGCFGDPSPNIKHWLQDQGYELLFQLAFNDAANMTVYYYLREKDHRVRIVCKVPHRTRANEYYCLPLNLLEIIREGSSLHLCRRKHSGSELILWASLQFTSIENMVAFFVSFLALRSQDNGHPVEGIRDYELEGERELYGGRIYDDDYSHALRIFRDKTTKAVRLQASVHKGEMNRTPVWTGFITTHLVRRGWLNRVSDRSVVIRDFKPIILMLPDDYMPPQTSRGDHVLKFATAADADAFVEMMEDLAAKYQRDYVIAS
ncbi:hypothetical protein N7462_009625 [Penicillium macrosclerotiorum]|uniref:uncharacterized protein n=1 Tax=Penicillium macrosclerotiorum TaxID=303699 RepID=UPI0025496732|nr:uncharacterized protein N7462_009625 [Penicillium macrosclerotiorum]KAJ5674186.1 hypothetical protein N7462_009625 [Penicillium macrosclerotiorum]